MNRRKPFTDTNHRQKVTNKRPSTFSLRPKASYVVQAALQKAELIMSTAKNQTKRIGDEITVPKTKFTTQNKSSDFRSISSPRLKSFPAEEIRRIERSPKRENAGQGDSYSHQPIPSTLTQHQGQSMSQQYFSQAPMNIPKYSEVLISSATSRPATIGKIHRPFVPNVQQHLSREPAEIIQQSQPNTTAPNPADNTKELPDDSECEKQPVGGRSAAIHRQRHLSQKRQSQSSPQTASIPPNHGELMPLIQNFAYPPPAYYHQYPPIQQSYLNYHPEHLNHHAIPNSQYLNDQQHPQNDQQYHNHNFTHQPEQQQSPNQLNPQMHNNIQHQQFRYQSQPSQNYEYPPLKSRNTQENKKKHPIPFTPAMIRDQEFLVMTMRQQGIPEDIMKRQFDALLNEQKRQLMYREQLEKEAEDTEEIPMNAGRKNSRFEDGKPEWMMHITPPWIPYALVEEMQNSKRLSKERIVKINNQQMKASSETNQLPPQIIDNPQQYLQYHQQMINNNQQYHEQQQQLQCMNNHMTSNEHQVRRHRQNNGLQDMATVKEAMEVLKNSANRPGLEYLANLSQKTRKIVLNGIQDPDDPLMKTLPYRQSGDVSSEVKRIEPSANGLENQRNPNNPPIPPSIIHRKHSKNDHAQEYPRRKVTFMKNPYHLPTNGENGIMGNPMIADYQQQYSPAFQNSGVFGDMTCKSNSSQAQAQFQAHGEAAALAANHTIPYNSMPVHSLPYDMCANEASINGFYANPEHNSTVNPTNIGQRNVNCPTQDCCRSDDFLQPLIIGGVKYLGRRHNTF